MAKKDASNDYRLERKERLAKAAKKSSKKKLDSVKVVSGIIYSVLGLLVVALVLFGLYQFGVPQRMFTAVKVGDRSYSIAEYDYYYMNVYQTYAQSASESGYSLFDYTKDPEAQQMTDEDGNTITYAEYFKNVVLENLEQSNYYLARAKEEGVELNEESKATVESTIASLESYAEQYQYSTSRYISLIYGKGLNLKKFRSILEEQSLVSQYVNEIAQKAYDSVTDDEIEAKYNEDPNAYNVVDVRLLGITIPTEEETENETENTAEEATVEETAEETTAETVEETTAEEVTEEADETEAAEETTAEETTEEETTEKEKSAAALEIEKKANEMLAKITDEESFIKLAPSYCDEDKVETFENPDATMAKSIQYSVIKNNIGEDLADWLFDENRAAGDKTVYTAEGYVYVIYMVNPAFRVETPLASARHILVSFDSVAAELKADVPEDTEEETVSESAAEETTVEATEETTVEAAEATTSEAIQETAPETAETSESSIASDNTKIEAVGTYSAEVVLNAYEKALDIMNEYKDGDQTEERFAELAEKYSEDPGSVGENATNGGGGLYTDIARGQMVEPFENWVYDETREVGDIGIVQTSYGYHVMYFVEKADEAAWKANIRTELGNKIVTDKEEADKENISDKAAEGSFFKWADKSALDLIRKLYVNNGN